MTEWPSPASEMEEATGLWVRLEGFLVKQWLPSHVTCPLHHEDKSCLGYLSKRLVELALLTRLRPNHLHSSCQREGSICLSCFLVSLKAQGQ